MDFSQVCVFALCFTLARVTAIKENGDSVSSSDAVNATKPDMNMKIGGNVSITNSSSSNITQKPQDLPRNKIRMKHKLGKYKRKHGTNDPGIPQAMTPLHVVATSAVIKNRLSRPRQPPKPVKAIHIWGPTPFNTVVNNLMKMNNKIQQQQKRLLLPYQSSRLQDYSPSQPEFLNLPDRNFMDKPDIQSQNRLPPIVQINERQNDDDKSLSEMGTSRMLLERPIYDQGLPVLQQDMGQPGPLDRSQDVFYSQYPQYNQGLPSFGNHHLFHHHHPHHHAGKIKAKCSPNPCVNDGVCTAFLHDYECTCPIGFMGKHCEDTNQCLPNPCKNNGNCYPTSTGFQCTCVRGYKGENCEAISKCIPSPCKNGAMCEEPVLVHEDFKCVCKPGYKGPNCEEADYCGLHNPCKNGGTCINGQATHVCRCSQGFLGNDCGDIDVCHSNPCANGGSCVSGGAGLFTCQCPNTFKGYTCGERKSRCESFPCQNGGRCVDDEGRSFRCVCASKYSGTLCQNARSLCESQPCQNHGKCVEMGNSFACICQPKYSGTTCEVFMDVKCSGCHRDAKCMLGKCACLSGFVGDGYVCKVLVDAKPTLSPSDTSKCHPNPCYNDGTCTEHESGFTCECRNGYTGPTCRVIQACLSQPCQHEGTCLDNKDLGTYVCKCKPGYTGINCEESPACQPADVCENGGTCIPDGDTYLCKCTKRYQGTRCEEDKCSLCDVHAHCEDGKCVCDDGYIGEGIKGDCYKRGASNPRFCLPNPCKNGGTCTELPNGYSCECLTEFSGVNCELERGVGAAPPRPKENPCSLLPCQHGGECIPQNGTFKCICPDDYKGKTCEAEVHHYCHPNPCLHGGTCLETSNGYTCKCIGSYRGQNCDDDDCDQCDIHAICVKGACRCRVGYKGDGFLCEKIKRCHHCNKYASCISNECVCNPGYTGNGQECQTDKCPACPSNAHCMRGVCVCGDGFYYDGKHCIGPPQTSSQPVCPDGCGTSTCNPSCPKHCCKVTVFPITDSCPSYCTPTSCPTTCQPECCMKSHLPIKSECPAGCQEHCTPSCPLHCCSTKTCPASCSDKCQSYCPIRCCSSDAIPAPPQRKATSISELDMGTQNPASLYLPTATACPANCASQCSFPCPSQCCQEENMKYTASENAVSRTLSTTTTGKQSSSNNKHSGLSPERRAKLIHSLSDLLPSPTEKCPDECGTSSCSYLCPAHCCLSNFKRTIHKPQNKHSHNSDDKRHE